MKKSLITSTLTIFACCLVALLIPQSAVAQPVQWINHLDFLPGDSTVLLDFQSYSCPGVGGLSGLAINSTTTGENGPSGGNKVIEKGLIVPHDFLVNGVRVCYENTSPNTFISQIRLCQLADPPSSCLVLLDDGADLVDPGPVCVNSSAPFLGAIDTNPDDPALEGALRLSLRVNFANTSDTICLRGVGLIGIENEKGAKRCTDGIDNDGDGLTDCDDSDCSNKPFCR